MTGRRVAPSPNALKALADVEPRFREALVLTTRLVDAMADGERNFALELALELESRLALAVQEIYSAQAA